MSDTSVISQRSLDPSNIRRDDYANTLVLEACRVGIMTESELERIKLELMTALSEVIGYFTKNESSSVKKDIAARLAKSLVYNIDTYLLTLGSDTAALAELCERRMSEMYGKGYLINQKRHKEAITLFGKARLTRLKNACEEYNKTLDKYFKIYLSSYDPKFGSHEKIYLSLTEYELHGAYRIDGAIEVLKKLIEINNGAAADYEITDGSLS